MRATRAAGHSRRGGKRRTLPPVQRTLYSAKLSVALHAGQDLQIFPPGPQTVTPSRADGEQATEMLLTIDAATAEALEADRAAYQAAADAGTGDAPYLDFNHEDGAAAAWPKRIFWAGDDPLLGGVRAEVEWSAAGSEAISGKTFRRFSPAFYAAEGRVTGAPVNMGGLVNRAAFQRIAPLFAKEPSPPPATDPIPTMNPEEIAALQAENTELKNNLAQLTAQLDALLKKEAEATVELAAKEGRIGTAPELKAKWVESILRDPSAKDLLLAMAPHPALSATPLITGKPPGATATPEEPAALLAKFNALPREEQAAFYRAHKDALRQTLG
jgi:hypothetical protein